VTSRFIYNMQPLLHVRDLQRSVAFYRDVLGFRVHGMFPEDDPSWAGLHSGNARIMLSSREAGDPAFTGAIYMYPDSIDDAWQRLRHDADVIEPLHVTEYGMREFAIRDPDGYRVNFGEPEREEGD
jgi:catechol 2,3-dioxygenase-like lactoylglutathione lyase family enzyme